jgi:hypothetical protein
VQVTELVGLSVWDAHKFTQSRLLYVCLVTMTQTQIAKADWHI